jgi:hypothetical protein
MRPHQNGLLDPCLLILVFLELIPYDEDLLELIHLPDCPDNVKFVQIN